ADREHPHIARHALDRKIARIAAGAEELQRIIDDLYRSFGGKDLGLRRELRIGKTAAVGPTRTGCVVEHEARCVELRLHVSKHPLQPLEFTDRTPELRATLYPGKCVIECSRRNSHGASTRANALLFVGFTATVNPGFEPGGRQDRHIVFDKKVFEDDFTFRHTAQTHRRFTHGHTDRAAIVTYRKETTDTEVLPAL